MKTAKLSAAVLVIAALSACRLGSMGEGRMNSIDANLGSLRHITGHAGGTPYKAWFQQMDLQLIEEGPDEGSQVRRRYYFHKNALFYFKQSNGAAIERQFFIDKHGAIRNTIPTPYPPTDLEQNRARAGELNKAAFTRAGQMFVFPLMRNP
ncbi:MAG: hypothetical protein JNK48_06045 [Bryobacterales bacterium]|nr:hypothetical protein [Bryobacterales bacterium]